MPPREPSQDDLPDHPRPILTDAPETGIGDLGEDQILHFIGKSELSEEWKRSGQLDSPDPDEIPPPEGA